jgi:hypothetical protein
VIGGVKYWATRVAKAIFFDKTGSLLVSENVEDAIKELAEKVAISASPGFTWGRSGSVTSNTWLNNDSVPSNLSGRTIFLSSASIKNVYIANQDATSGIILGVYSHDGDENNLTLLGTVTTAATRSNSFSVDWSVATNKQIAIKTESTSAAGKNLVVGVLVKGSI